MKDALDYYLDSRTEVQSAYQLAQRFEKHLSTVTARLKEQNFEKVASTGSWIKITTLDYKQLLKEIKEMKATLSVTKEQGLETKGVVEELRAKLSELSERGV